MHKNEISSLAHAQTILDVARQGSSKVEAGSHGSPNSYAFCVSCEVRYYLFSTS